MNGSRYLLGHNRRKMIDIGRVCRLYEERGLSIAETAETTGQCENVIKRCLRQGGVRTRTLKEASLLAGSKGKYYMQTAEGKKRHGRMMKGHSFNRRHVYNRSFFKAVDRDAAYVFGFVQADGCISDDRRLIICIKDRELLETIASRIGQKGVKAKGKYCWLEYSSWEMAEDLRKLGFFRKEGFSRPRIPEDVLSHFVRGFFDGDGCVSFNRALRKYVSCFSCRDVQFLQYLKDLIGFDGGCIRKYSRNCFELRLGEPDTAMLGRFIYGDFAPDRDLYLQRKWLRFQQLFAQKGVIS